MPLRGEVELLRGGGVRMRRENIERGINEKILLNREEKERIARYAAELIHDNDVVYLDPSQPQLHPRRLYPCQQCRKW